MTGVHPPPQAKESVLNDSFVWQHKHVISLYVSAGHARVHSFMSYIYTPKTVLSTCRPVVLSTCIYKLHLDYIHKSFLFRCTYAYISKHVCLGEGPVFIIGINHGFQCSNIRWITRKVFEHKAAGRVFKLLPSDPANV